MARKPLNKADQSDASEALSIRLKAPIMAILKTKASTEKRPLSDVARDALAIGLGVTEKDILRMEAETLRKKAAELERQAAA